MSERRRCTVDRLQIHSLGMPVALLQNRPNIQGFRLDTDMGGTRSCWQSPDVLVLRQDIQTCRPDMLPICLELLLEIA
jgi:hypothetical protein